MCSDTGVNIGHQELNQLFTAVVASTQFVRAQPSLGNAACVSVTVHMTSSGILTE